MTPTQNKKGEMETAERSAVDREFKKVFITGASRGLGYYTTRQLVARGHSVWGTSRNFSSLEVLASECKDLPGSLHKIEWDGENPHLSLERPIDKGPGQLDLVINNAAAFLKKQWDTLTEEDMLQLYRVNVVRPLQIAQLMKPRMREGGHLVNISSVGGVQGSLKFPGLLPYSTSKGALNVLTECLAAEWESLPLYCNALALGSSSTEMFHAAFPGMEAASTPEQMGDFVAHFALRAAPLIHGKVFSISSQNP